MMYRMPISIDRSQHQSTLVSISKLINMICMLRIINILSFISIMFVCVYCIKNYSNNDNSKPVNAHSTVNTFTLSKYESSNVSLQTTNKSYFQNRNSVNWFAEKLKNTMLSRGKHRRATSDRENQRKNRNDYAVLHIIRLPNEMELRHSNIAYQTKERKTAQEINKYESWSKWSPCTRLCMTQRHRRCINPSICDHDFIRENAYCYIDGSFCQKWIYRRIQNFRKNNNEETVVYKTNRDIISDVGNDEIHKRWKCGVRRGKKQIVKYSLKIIGGHPSIPGDWPWQVALLNSFQEVFCGGTLISPKWVLTAAHCVRKHLYVRLGEYDLTLAEGTEIELKVDSAAIHPNFNTRTVDNDVALLRLPITLIPSAVYGIACLPTAGQLLPTNQLCTIIGWGKLNATAHLGTEVLHETRIPIVPMKLCRHMYENYKITSNMLCAGFRGGRMDSCAGDSGGPLLCRNTYEPNQPWTVFGITSFGEGCGEQDKFGIYTKLTNYVDWIARIMNE